MKIYEARDSDLTISTEYKLLNSVSLFLMLDREKLLVRYMRGDQMMQSEVSFCDMDMICSGLSKTIVLLSNQYTDTAQFVRHAKATCAYLFGSYIDLNRVDGNRRSFSYVSNIKIRQCDDPAVFLFEGLFFRLGQKNTYGIQKVECGPYGTSVLMAEAMEKLWPGSVTSIPAMNALDYSDAEILKILVESCHFRVSNVDVVLPKSDSTNDFGSEVTS